MKKAFGLCAVLVICSVWQRLYAQPAGGQTLLVPQFYCCYPRYDKDTSWKFEAYDSRDSLVNIDTVKSIKDVWFFSLFKSFTDSAHTYRDADGSRKLLPVSSIIRRYDRKGKDKWISIDYSRNKYEELREYPDVIVKTDTIVVANAATGQKRQVINKYYKVTAISY